MYTRLLNVVDIIVDNIKMDNIKEKDNKPGLPFVFIDRVQIYRYLQKNGFYHLSREFNVNV